MRKLMILAMMLAMVVVAAAPALAQSGTGNYGDQYTPPDLYDQVCEIAAQEEAQRILDEDSSDPHDLDSDGDGIACNSEDNGSNPDEPADGEATLNYELTVEGQCPADATFFGENNLVGAADYVGTVQLTDPDGDGVYTHSEEFTVGSELDGLSIVQGTGINENFNSSFFQGPVPGEPITPVKSFNAVTLEEDTTLSASVSCDDPVEPNREEATLDFELTVEGQCPADTNFFAGMNTSHGYSVPLTDPDGDSVYSGSIDFGKGTDLLEVGLYKGTGIQEGPYGQIPVGEPETIQTFGNLTVEKDETFSATASCDEPPAKKSKPDPAVTKNTQSSNIQGGSPQGSSGTDAGENSQTGILEGVQTGLEKLPDTGGMSLMLLGGGALLIGGGLLARRILR